MLVKVPFEGFYNSYLSNEIECALDIEIECLNEESNAFEFQYFKDGFFEAIAQEYVNYYFWQLSLVTNFEIYPTNVSLQKSEDYCFYNDTVTCEIEDEEFLELFKVCDKNILKREIHERLKPHSGFVPFYPNDLNQWDKNPLNWTVAQTEFVLDCLYSCYSPFGFSDYCVDKIHELVNEYAVFVETDE